MRYLKTYENFDLADFDYAPAIKEIIKYAITLDSGVFFLESIELSNSEKIGYAESDDSYSYIEELFVLKAKVRKYDYDEDFLLQEYYIKYENMNSVIQERIWDYLQESEDIDHHPKWNIKE